MSENMDNFILGFITGLNVRGALHKAEVLPDKPVEAAYCLYGTPNESGNVALADGDGYTLYNGAVLPKLPEWDKGYYPNAIIQPFGTIYRFVVSTKQAYWDGSYTREQDNAIGIMWEYDASRHEAWVEIPITGSVTYTPILWANYDVKTSDGAVYLAATAPIPLASSEPVAAVYEGMRWDVRTYPYACYGKSGWGETFFIYSKKPCEQSENTGMYVMAGVVYELVNEKWEYQFDSSATTGGGRTVITPSWSNHDVISNDGSLYLAASDPIPVYEQKE